MESKFLGFCFGDEVHPKPSSSDVSREPASLGLIQGAILNFRMAFSHKNTTVDGSEIPRVPPPFGYIPNPSLLHNGRFFLPIAQPDRIHGIGTYTYTSGWFFIANVGKYYTSPMDPMGTDAGFQNHQQYVAA